MNKNNVIIGTLIAFLLVGGVAWLAMSSGNSSSAQAPAGSLHGKLVAVEPSYDFGAISMAKGTVSHLFKIKNEGTETVNLSKLYTSCMCTTAILRLGNVQEGPFGMEGMGYIPYFSHNLKPGEEAEIEAIFDPAAHGPAGVGQIERVILLENNTGDNPLSITFSANVTP